jgi:cyanophycinase
MHHGSVVARVGARHGRRAAVVCHHAAAALLALTLAACASGRPAQPATSAADASGSVRAGATTGPARGALVIAGGGRLDTEVMGRFIELAGGRDARIVILPGAATDDTFPADWSGYRVFRDAGVREVAVLHTRDRAVADSDAFVRPLRTATGVWIPGGRQWRLVDAYLGTRTLRELHALLGRGGVIGGSSAGASIQASYMVRGAVEGNTVMMAPGYEEGFGFLRDAAIDQHLLARGREDDMLAVIARHPQLLGIGIDEGTAIVVTGDRAEVVGRGSVAFYNVADPGELPYYFLRRGAVFDLGARTTLQGARAAPHTVRAGAAVTAVMNRLFDAMRAQDTALIRTISHPDLRVFVPGEQGGAPTLRVSTLQQFMQSVAAALERLDERAFDPEIRVDGNLASIWTYYEFRRGSEFSHCGVDAFHFARTADGWQIIGLAYTVRRDGCRPPDPS